MNNPLFSNSLAPTGNCLLRVVVPELQVANVAFNTGMIQDAMQQAAAGCSQPQLVLFPELCLTGSTCGDLFFQPLLQEKALEGLARLQKSAKQLNLWAVVGLPLVFAGQLYDAAVLLSPQGLAGVSLAAEPRDFSGRYPSRWLPQLLRCLPKKSTCLASTFLSPLISRCSCLSSRLGAYRFALATCEMVNMTTRSACC